MESLGKWLAEATEELSSGGRWIVVAYSALPGEPTAVKVLLGATRFLGRILGDLRNAYPDLIFHLGRAVPDTLVDKVAAERSDCRLHSLSHPSLNWADVEHRKLVSQQLSRRSPRFWRSRGVGLLDISGFSTLPAPTQIGLRLLLDLAITQARTNLRKNLPPDHVVSFHRVSSGDGYYLWNRIPGPYADAITFALLTLVMALVRGRERELPDLRLRAAYTVGEMYTFPYEGLWAESPVDGGLEDAIGPALNIAARLCTAAVPDQLLVSAFGVSADPDKGQYRDPLTLLTFVKGLFPNPKTPVDLALEPARELRVVDKHGDVYHCYNVHGRGFYFTGPTPREHEVGLAEDSAPLIDDYAFRRLTTGAF